MDNQRHCHDGPNQMKTNKFEVGMRMTLSNFNYVFGRSVGTRHQLPSKGGQVLYHHHEHGSRMKIV